MEINGCTDEQAIKMAVLAINSSEQIGTGKLHANLNAEESQIRIEDGEIHIDYFNGRMVKFHARRYNEGWMFWPDGVRLDYQSWAAKYFGYDKLYEEVTKEV